MKIESFTSPVKEVYIETDDNDFSVTATTWANHEGCSVILHGKNLNIRGCFSLKWEELDALSIALQTARAA